MQLIKPVPLSASQTCVPVQRLHYTKGQARWRYAEDVVVSVNVLGNYSLTVFCQDTSNSVLKPIKQSIEIMKK